MTYPNSFDSLSKPSPTTIRAATVGISPANTVSSIIQSLQFAEYKVGLAATAVAFTADSGTDTLTANSHGLANADVLALATTSALPGGLAIDTPYYVIGVTANTFQLAATRGGSAIDLTSTGTGTQSFIVLFSEGKLLMSNTGATTSSWSNALSLASGSLVLPQSSSIAPTAEGSVGWDTDDDLLKIGTGAATKTMVDTNSTQTLSGKTLTAPTIADFTNAVHDHLDTDDGGTLTPAAVVNPYKAKAHAATNQTISDATATVVTFGTEDYDPNGNFASNAYTVPRTGYYQVNVTVTISAGGKGASYRVNLRKSSTDIAQIQNVPFPAATLYGDVSLSFSDTLLLTSGDVMDVRALCDTSDSSSPVILGGATNQFTFCSFHLLSE